MYSELSSEDFLAAWTFRFSRLLQIQHIRKTLRKIIWRKFTMITALNDGMTNKKFRIFTFNWILLREANGIPNEFAFSEIEMSESALYIRAIKVWRIKAVQTERPVAHQIITHRNRNPLNVLNEMIVVSYLIGSNCLIVGWLWSWSLQQWMRIAPEISNEIDRTSVSMKIISQKTESSRWWLIIEKPARLWYKTISRSIQHTYNGFKYTHHWN